MAGDPVVARLASNNQVTNQGGRAWYEFRFTANEANNRWFSLSSPGAGTFTFTFKTSPDANSPVELPLQGALTQAAWLTLVRKVLESNFYLMEHYTVRDSNNGGPAILLEAIKHGIAFQITANAGTCVNLALVTSNTGANRSQRDNFRILVETYVRQNLNFRRKGTGDLLAVDVDGIGFAQVEAYLEERPINQFAWPPLPINPASFRNQLANAAYIRWAESYGMPEQIQRLTSGDEFVVLQGRLPNKRKVSFYNQYANWQAYFQQTKRFLTWQPLVKEVYADQPEKLYWFHFYEDRPQYKIRVRRVLQNGTSTTIDYLAGLVGTPYTVCEIETSPSILAPGISNLAELHVWIAANDNTILSAIQSYIIKPKPAQVQYFFFENSFGAFDTVAFTGVVEESDDYQREVEEVYQPQTFRAGARRMRSFRTEQREEFTTHSGYTTDNEIIDWYDDLLNSPAPYEVVGNQLHEVVIESGKVLKRRTEEFVKAISFTYRRMAPIQVYRTVPAGVLNATPVIDPGEPSPPFPPQVVPGLGGFDEFYLPGNSWLALDTPVSNTDAFSLMAIVRPDLGGKVILGHSSSRSQVWLNAPGDTLFIRPQNDVPDIQVPLTVKLVQQYYLLELYVASNNYLLLVNGNEISSGSLGGATSFSFNRFGTKGTVGYFVGRVSTLRFGQFQQSETERLQLANRFGIAVDGAGWLTSYEPEFAMYLVQNYITRDQVINRDLQVKPVTASPIFTPPAGIYSAEFPLNIQSATPGAVVYFTDNATDPTFSSPIFSTNILVDENSTYKAFALAPGHLPSPIVTQAYILDSNPDLTAYINAENITNPTIITAISNAIASLKSQGLWPKVRILYLFAGGNQNGFRHNVKDPRSLNEAFRAQFMGTWTYNGRGIIGNGVNTYLRTFLDQSFFNTENGLSFGVGLRTSRPFDGAVNFRGYIGTSTAILDAAFNTMRWYFMDLNTNVNLGSGASNVGVWGMSMPRTGFGDQWNRLLNTGVVNSQTASRATLTPSREIFIGARNNGTSIDGYFAEEMGSAWVGTYMTASELQMMRTILNQYNAAIS